MSELEVDVACVVLRIEQIVELPPGEALREHLIERLKCDAFRLRQYIGPEKLAEMERIKADPMHVIVFGNGDGS